ncbi:hypothetical protein KDA_35430 [Dictyobacter alpinus]|uniref:DUF4388 domain-containing protein n=1 Tax=Dictyobacter alpinus TaxID=2014873 RepID=A0A402B9S7_9CHLR|nr:hypothetical protein [Dictyobacter alpinus]GCE28059.1 hypothetical protein KDA_35430 [Dictyobacter alpinus]
MYSLDLETLIGVLQHRQIQGVLEADLATGQVSEKLRKGSARIELSAGKIISASIYDKNGRILYQGNEAIQKISRIVFSWQLTEAPSATTLTVDREPISGRLPLPGSLDTDPSLRRATNTDPLLRRATNTDPLASYSPDIRSDWEGLRQQSPMTTQPLSNSGVHAGAEYGVLIPIRHQNLSPVYLRNMSRSTRNIYALINGKNSIERIAGLLSLPINVVYFELLGLQREAIIYLAKDA